LHFVHNGKFISDISNKILLRSKDAFMQQDLHLLQGSRKHSPAKILKQFQTVAIFNC